MDQCLRLLRAKCVYCHKLKMSRAEVNRYACKLTLVRYGLLKECFDLDDIHIAPKSKDIAAPDTSKDNDGNDSSDSDQDSNTKDIIHRRNVFVRNAIKQAGKRRGDWEDAKIEAVANERRAIVKEFLYSITKGKKCANCAGISPSYRKDRFVKIFRKPLSEKDRVSMVQLGFKAQDPLVLLKKKRDADAAANRKKGLEQDEGIADMEDSPPESEGEGDDIDMLDIEREVAGGNAFEADAGAAAAAAASRTKNGKKSDSEQGYLNAGQVHAALVQLFDQEADVLGLVYSPRSKSRRGAPLSADMFFIKDIVVPPNRYRPEARTGADEIAEAQENSLYKNVLNQCDVMAQIHKELNGLTIAEAGRRARNYADFQDAWIRLQDAVNSLLDRDRNPVQGGAGKRNEDGIKQRLEKKEGLFRKNMMGKRVNFAARTVISPDPNIETNEIGVPPVFALKLTYPEPVNDHNYDDLRQAVINGPNIWPGAMAIENENGQVINLQIKNREERTALANQLQAPSTVNMNGAKVKKVHRHLNNGDIVIMNRQPTLHKPSMMCHRARVLPGEKTLRMHYANCNTYNADFDGDEMNMHFPQNELARAEAVGIADTDHQYLAGTAGKPLRGLIQDHISMGVWLTNRDTFFNREDYQQLLYAGLRPESGHTTSGRLVTLPPAVLKPRPLWTGKQVISTVMKNLTPTDTPGLTITSKSSTSATQWAPGKESEEQVVIFQGGELLCGILDKAQIGPSGGGVVNAVYEAFGHTIAGKLLSILGRLLTKMLHMRAFSCGVEDLVFTQKGEDMRREALSKASTIGLEVAAKYVSLQNEKPDTNDPELRRRLEDVLREEAKQAGLDGVMNAATAAQLSSVVTNTCLPAGLVKPFPKNQMQAMTGSGAKGSGVNANQISCNLGQQVLEGRRVPVMVSGKTLPCFKPFESSVRAGGYIVDRFLTGVRPQEYYFHAMAGREGLIDTAVKTSRSGYLQRCLIKGMEGLKAEYDTSVRDADGSVVQFLYGEDGLDVGKAKYLYDFKFIAENHLALFNALGIRDEFSRIISTEADDYNKKAEKQYRKTGDLGVCDPALSVYSPSTHAGSTSEKLVRSFKKYCDENPDNLIKDKKKATAAPLTKKNLQAIVDVRYLKSIVEAGEAVGVVAGQSVGEPSTQMTLNTFHLAGHAAKNVTLGIPRLREIVMTASAQIGTPTMTLHLNPEINEEDGKKFAKGISKLSLAEVLDKVTVTEKLGKGIAHGQAKMYTVKLDLFPSDEYCAEYAITVDDVVRTIETKFLPRLQATIRKELKKKGDQKLLRKADDALPEIGKAAGTIEQDDGRAGGEAEGGDDDSDNEGDDDATRDKAKGNKSQSGYEAPDEDEEAIATQARRETTPEADENEDETYGSQGSDDSDSSDSESEGEKKARIASNAEAREARIKSSKHTSDISAFNFNDATGSTCTFTLEYDASTAKLLMLNLIENTLHTSLIQSIPSLGSCAVTKEKYPNPLTGKDEEVLAISTEGENLRAMWEFQDVLNPHRFFTNDIAAMLRLYGVEACRSAIVREVSGVFIGHGISVDLRHLSLIADYMTRGGGYQAFSRMGIKNNVSPFMKMSFETTVGFLRDAVLEEDWDDLKGPSGRIVVGKVGTIGTGGFDVLMPVVEREIGDDEEEVEMEVDGKSRKRRVEDDSSSEEEEEESSDDEE